MPEERKILPGLLWLYDYESLNWLKWGEKKKNKK